MPTLVQALSPVEALTNLYNMDRRSARFLTGSIGVFAAAAIVIGFGTDLQTILILALYIVGMGLLLSIVTQLPAVLRLILGTFLVIMIITVTTLFLISAITDRPKPSYCLAKFWLKCEAAEEQVAARNAGTLDAAVSVPAVIGVAPAGAAATAPGADARPGYGASGRGPASTGARPAAKAPLVYIQFAGLITRESVTELNAALRRGGWRVAGGSGERTETAAGLNELRYPPGTDPATAAALAAAVTATGIAKAPVTPREVRIITPGTLELWISN